MPVLVVDGDLPTEIARELRKAGRIAVDTETSGLDWTTEHLQLCQVHAPTTGSVLIRNVIRRPVELAHVFGDPSIVKVFHFAPFDLRFLEAKWGIHTLSVECTKAASKLLDPGLPSAQHSLQALLDRHLGTWVSKGRVRTSDWGARELSDEQVAYAVADVAYLLDLADALAPKLAARGMQDVFSQVCAYMPVDAQLAVSGVPDPLSY